MKFNSELMRVARQSRGYSQAELSHRSGLSQGNISKIENGISDPPDDAVEKIAKALAFPVSFFFQAYQPFGLPVSVHPMFRKKASVGAKALEQLEAELNVRLFHYQKLLRAAEVETDLPLPRLDIDDYDGDATTIADLVRRTWAIPNGPIKNLVEYIERAGCVVVHCDFDAIGVDGVTVSLKGLPPFIFLNRANPADRQRFTLAHELGHIVMHRLPTPQMEDEANQFASALLMPPDQIRPYLSGKLTIQKLASLKPVWRVSMAALLVNAHKLGCITDNQNQWLWRTFSSMGYRKREPEELDLPLEKPTIIDEVFQLHAEEFGYSPEEIAAALHVELEDAQKLYPSAFSKPGPHLRLIK
ncbi:XRE family transcriptional regulator [Pseudomonas oleovorans]|uniref:XRE family transcriptional regulator n=1 Tax=Ectopseudomonas oleovorans TaxID=301 RepID=A0AB35L1A5_ECTOL|nr:XRE family transcriptional regulator [Pseudomonas oleovorans]MCR1827861.1 XRE family transcriptional regulator [Pseudomonas oleovorans]MDH0568447.1 XRE family transcriptional regulator [Pseudomonas oleovorans]